MACRVRLVARVRKLDFASAYGDERAGDPALAPHGTDLVLVVAEDGANGSEELMKAKLVTGKFFMERVLPEHATHLKRIQTGADTMMALPAEAF